MNIRPKVMILLTLLFVLLGGASLVVQDLIVMPSFARLEEANAQTAMKRVRYAMDRSLEYLQINTMDWANWGDAYQFVQDHNANFIKTNVTIPALKQLQVNTILIIDLDGRVVMGTGDVLHTALTLQGSIVSGSSLSADFPWRNYLGTTTPTSGLVRTNLGVMMIAGAPIQDGSGSGQPMGMIIMGRLLTPARLRRIESQTQYSIAMADQGAPAESATLVDTDSVTQAYGSFKDVFGKPLMTLRVDVPREITTRGHAVIRYASASLIGAAVFVLILILILLNRLVLAPLTSLTRHAVAVGHDDDMSARLNFTREDEFGRLACEFDHMVARLADTRRQLVDQSFQAGFAELAKGVLHNLGNALTPLGVRLATMEKRMREAPVADLEQAAAELSGDAGDAARRAALLEFIGLGCREMTLVVRGTEADIGVMQRQAALMRASLSEQMRASADKMPVLESVKLPDLIQQSLEIVPDASRQRLQVETDESLQKVGVVRVARTVLRLVLQNLIINAADAVRDAGKDKGVLRVGAEIVREAGREQLHLHCEDNGVGIPNDQLERVFEKGFSTKSRETNHGIGLHWCANALLALGGRIWAASEGPGRGASLHLMLPMGARETGSITR